MFSKGLLRGEEGFPLETAAQHGDRFGGQLGEIGEGASLDLAVLAIALAQQDSGGRAALLVVWWLVDSTI